ncbi:MAG: hypothetical protein HQK96_17910 [Nitrospirae bacterium]|nr:hypothetical protein [Nitrospirota bacterium]
MIKTITAAFMVVIAAFATLTVFIFAPYTVEAAGKEVNFVLLNRVTAFIDNVAIPLSEFEESFDVAKKQTPGITKQEVIEGMINRKLLIRAAKEAHITGVSDDDTIKEFINLKIRSYVLIKNEDIESYYNANRAGFEGRQIMDVKDEIEKYLTEEQVNKNLKALLKELHENSYIKIQLTGE